MLELLTDVNMLLMVEKGIRVGTCYAIHRYIKANDKYMENYNKKQRIIISYVFRCKQFAWMGNIPKTTCKQFGKQIHLNLIKNLLKFMMKIVKKDVFLK